VRSGAGASPETNWRRPIEVGYHPLALGDSGSRGRSEADCVPHRRRGTVVCPAAAPGGTHRRHRARDEAAVWPGDQGV